MGGRKGGRKEGRIRHPVAAEAVVPCWIYHLGRKEGKEGRKEGREGR
jgi:hypothetical protein